MKSLLPLILTLFASPLAAQTLINPKTINPAGSITVTSYTATAIGNNQYSIQTASGIKVNAGTVVAPTFSGSGAGLSSIPTGAVNGLQTQFDAIAGSTNASRTDTWNQFGQIATSTNATNTRFNEVGSATATARADAWNQFGQVAASTAATDTRFNEVGSATATARADAWNQFGQVAASTAATNTRLNEVGSATATARADAWNQFEQVAVSTNATNLTLIDLYDSKVDKAGDSMTGPLTLLSPATATINGQDADGFSVKVASGIDAGNGCLKVQGGLICAPGGSGTGGHIISTYSTTTGGLSHFVARSTLAFDGQFFVAQDSPSWNATLISLKTGEANKVWQVIEEKNLSASASVTFSTVLSPAESYRLEYNVTQNASAGYYYIQFNGDSGNNYKMHALAYNSSATGDSYANNGREWCIISGAGTVDYLSKPGYISRGSVDCNAQQDDYTRVMCNSANTHMTTASSYAEHSESGCFYDGVSSLNSWTFGTSAGTISGTVKLMKLDYLSTPAISVPASTFTYMNNDIAWPNTDGTLGVCVATVSMTPSSDKLDVIFTGSVLAVGAGYGSAYGVLVNGSFPSPYTSLIGMMTLGASGTSQIPHNASFVYPNLAVSPGVPLNICLTATQDTAGGIICPSAGTYHDAVKCRFGVREVRNTAGTGDAATNGINTWSQANKFTDLRMGAAVTTPAVYASTVSYANMARGVWTTVAYASVTASTDDIVFTNFNSSYTHRLQIHMYNSGAGCSPRISFNGDKVGNWKYASGVWNSGSGGSFAGSSAAGGFILIENEYVLYNGLDFSSEVRLDCATPASGTRCFAHALSDWYRADGLFNHSSQGGAWPISSPITSMSLYPNGGCSWTGYATLEALWTPLVP